MVGWMAAKKVELTVGNSVGLMVDMMAASMVDYSVGWLVGKKVVNLVWKEAASMAAWRVVLLAE